MFEMDSDNADFDEAKLGMVEEELGEGATFSLARHIFGQALCLLCLS